MSGGTSFYESVNEAKRQRRIGELDEVRVLLGLTLDRLSHTADDEDATGYRTAVRPVERKLRDAFQEIGRVQSAVLGGSDPNQDDPESHNPALRFKVTDNADEDASAVAVG